MNFKLVLIVVSGFTLLLLLLSVGLSILYETPTPQIAKTIDRTWTGFWAGFGAIIGLLGGKAL